MNHAFSSDTEETALGRSFDRTLIRRLWPYARPYLGLVTLSLLLLPAATAIQLWQPLLVRTAVDAHLTTGNLAGFDRLLLLLLGLLLAQFGIGYLQSLLTGHLGQLVIRDLRRDLFAHLLNQDAAYFTATSGGRITNRLANDTEAVSQMVSAGLINLVGDFILLGGIALSILLLAPGFALVILLGLPIIVWVTVDSARKLRLTQRQGMLAQSRMAAQLGEEATGHQVVRLFHRQEHNHRQFDRVNREYLDHALRANWYEVFQFNFVEAAAAVAIACLLLVGGFLVPGGTVTLGTVVAFIEYVRRIFFPIRDLSSKFTTMQAAMTALERIFAFLDTRPGIIPPPAPLPLESPRGEIRFTGVEFGYRPEQPVLREIDLVIPAGTRVALVGPTGSGKSSLIKLLNRTHDPVRGTITIDGRGVESMPLDQLRHTVGMIQQDSFIFAGTIGFNIGLGDPAITPERIVWAATQSGALEFIHQLPHGLETRILERGANLSAGQRQLLGIARVLAAAPAILVMDEATSAVDTISERLIQAALERLLAGRTALIIAHRLSTILTADLIVVLSHGRIVERGTHAELLAMGGLYSQLYALQFGE